MRHRMRVFSLVLIVFSLSARAQDSDWCGGTDDRVASNHLAIARLRPGGDRPVTAWLIPNGKFVTAGHVLSYLPSGSYVEFNVPLSDSDGAWNPSAAEDQYEIDNNSLVYSPSPEGGDWGVFEVFPNNITGLSPLQAQGVALTVIQSNGGSVLRVTGYGEDQREANYTQQTDAGANLDTVGTIIRYYVDVTHGSSGSPVIDEATGFAIGVDTDIHCVSSGYNSGTSTINQEFWDAMGLQVVTVYQGPEEGGSVGTVGRWAGTSFEPRFTPPKTFSFGLGFTETLHADTVLYSGEKYNNWNGLADVINHHQFPIVQGMGDLWAFLKATFGGVTIKTDLLDAPGTTGDSVQFRDPWFIDYPDPLYGNNRRNRGKDLAAWYTRKSPFYPNIASFDGNVYNGVFLGQTDPTGPQYRVRAKQSIPISGITSYFQKWSGTYASFQDSSAMETPAVFTSGSAVATARYKAHLASSSTAVTAPTMQRKIIRDANGNYHMVYESGGSIWYSRSTNAGTTWSPEAAVYIGGNGYVLRNPSLTMQDNPDRIVAVCEEYHTQGNARDILLRTIDPASGTMLTDEVVWSDYPGIAVTTPLVASGIDNTYGRYVIAAWYDSATGTILSRVRRAPDGTWGNVTTLRTAQASGLSLAPVINAGDRRWHLVWIEGGNLYHGDISIGLNPVLTLPTIIANGALEIQITNPSVVNQNGGWPGVAWEEYNDEINKRVIKYRERIGTTSWSTTKVFSDASANPGFRTPSVTGHETVSDVSLAWRKGTSQLKYVQRIGGVWGSQKNLSTGVDPMTSVGWQYSTSELVLSRGTTAPYPIQQTTISYGSGQGPLASKGDALDPITSRPEGRGGKLIFPGGFINLAVLRAQIDTLPLPFAAVNDTVPIGTLDDFITALTSTPFTGRGTLALELLYSASGEVPPGATFRLVAKDARTKKAVLVPRIFTGIRDTILTISVPLNFPNRTFELALVPQGIKDNLVFEVERWFIDTEAAGLQPELVAGTSTGTGENGQQIPTVYLLWQNFPNPFNPTTMISYQLPEAAHVAIRLYDVLGQEVQTLVDDVKEAGHYQITLDASRLASGIYFYKMVAGNYAAVRKLVLMK